MPKTYFLPLDNPGWSCFASTGIDHWRELAPWAVEQMIFTKRRYDPRSRRWLPVDPHWPWEVRHAVYEEARHDMVVRIINVG